MLIDHLVSLNNDLTTLMKLEFFGPSFEIFRPDAFFNLLSQRKVSCGYTCGHVD